MNALLGIVFLAVVIAVLAIGLGLDRSSSRANILRERLKSIDSAAKRGATAEVEILRDELLSGIPALNRLLSRWSRSSRLQLLLEQADMQLRPGKFLLVSACTAVAGACLVLAAIGIFAFFLLGFLAGGALPVAYMFFL
ncbi:MAG TPA: hypothetical protein VKH81_03930, partial [Candidatus Angelobacter sp.]|nr:hypothetical protein [Candidatus Angelobacter sp.]